MKKQAKAFLISALITLISFSAGSFSRAEELHTRDSRTDSGKVSVESDERFKRAEDGSVSYEYSSYKLYYYYYNKDLYKRLYGDKDPLEDASYPTCSTSSDGSKMTLEYDPLIAVKYGEELPLPKTIGVASYEDRDDDIMVNGKIQRSHISGIFPEHAVEKEIKWDDFPKEWLLCPAGSEFILHGTADGIELQVNVIIFPSPDANSARKGTDQDLKKDGEYYVNEDASLKGRFYDLDNGSRLVFEDGSYLTSSWQKMDGKYCYFTPDGILEHNAYVDGYRLDGGGARVNGESYKWDGDRYVDANGKCARSEYRLIDGHVNYFDAKGHKVQTFDYPFYKLHDGNVLIGVLKQFDNTDRQKILDRITEIRKEAVKLKVLKKEDFVVPKWSYESERIAMVRAVEASIGQSAGPHSRLAFNARPITFNGIKGSEGCLAWGCATNIASINLYYTEKENLLTNNGGVTGHYTNLLTGEYVAAAQAGSTNAYVPWYKGSTTDNVKFEDYSVQIVEATRSKLDKKILKKGSKVRDTVIYSYNTDDFANFSKGKGWSKDRNGRKVYSEYGKTVTNDFRVIDNVPYFLDVNGAPKRIKKNTVFELYSNRYKVKSLKIKDNRITEIDTEFENPRYQYLYSLEVNDITNGRVLIKVSSIGKNIYKGNKYLQEVVIGPGVKAIGEGAFSNCRNLKKVTVKSKKLSKKTVAKNVFAKANKKLKVKVPKKKKSAYKKVFRSVSKKAIT